MLEKSDIEQLRQEIGAESVSSVSCSNPRRVFLAVTPLCVRAAVAFLKKNGFFQLCTITGTQTDDNLIELLYHFDKAGAILTLRVLLPEKEQAIPTISDIIPGALLYEREIHDLYGVDFTGHPSLHKLVLPDEWNDQSYPLKT
jgi:NADH-quinone oxidoreductase subunit C